MGRWRPPPPTSSAYITPKGFEALQAELAELWLRRRDVVKALADAAAEGDRSENAEYIYRKKQLREIDRRVRYLRKRLDVLKVVDRLPADRDAVYFGATVELEERSGQRQTWRIVGADEMDPSAGHISIDSPLAQALLRKRAGDEIQVRVPRGDDWYRIVSVGYETESQS